MFITFVIAGEAVGRGEEGYGAYFESFWILTRDCDHSCPVVC